jgi:dTDP-4-amino-4,6-dideoxygalactose transaminase
MKIIPYGRQYIDAQDIKHVSQSLKKKLITTGEYVQKFENQIEQFLKVKFAISCNSGTSALHLALMAIDLKKNDTIIMPAINFIAVFNMARLMNAKIFLADVDSSTGQMTPRTLLKCIKDNNLKKIKAIVTMYLGGYPENVVDFYSIKKKFSCYLIEDACHALGAKYFHNNKYLFVGSCKHADISTFSLHPVKTITSGEGGIVTTNNKKFYNKIKFLKSHGIKKMKDHWLYDVKFIGFNYRLSDINCALAISQLKKIKYFITFREKVYKFYKKNLANEVNFVNYDKKIKPAYHLLLIKLKSNKNIFIKKMLKSKIMAQFHYIPIFKFKNVFFDKFISTNYSGSLDYHKSIVSIPIYVGLSEKEQLYIVKTIKKIVGSTYEK